jgi:hypothetical protein
MFKQTIWTLTFSGPFGHSLAKDGRLPVFQFQSECRCERVANNSAFHRIPQRLKPRN